MTTHRRGLMGRCVYPSDSLLHIQGSERIWMRYGICGAHTENLFRKFDTFSHLLNVQYV
jgi:hypothetical protein